LLDTIYERYEKFKYNYVGPSCVIFLGKKCLAKGEGLKKRAARYFWGGSRAGHQVDRKEGARPVRIEKSLTQLYTVPPCCQSIKKQTGIA
jgi:hypothetical protein